MCKEITTWHSCGHGSETTVHCWRYKDLACDIVACKSFSQPSLASRGKCVKCKETQELGVARNPYTSLMSSTGLPTEEPFFSTKSTIANSARKVRTQAQDLVRTIAHPSESTQGMTRSLPQPLSRNNVVVQCLDNLLHSEKEQPPPYEETQDKY
jgi:hypothetical protein